MLKPKKFRVRGLVDGVVFEAVRWTGDNQDEIRAFAPAPSYLRFSDQLNPDGSVLKIYGNLETYSYEGPEPASVGDWIVKYKSVFEPYNPDVFEATFEAVAEDDTQ